MVTLFSLPYWSYWAVNQGNVQADLTCGLVDKALDSRSKGLRVDSQSWSCIEMSGKLISYCVCLRSSEGYPMEGKKCANADFCSEKMRLQGSVFHNQGCKTVQSLNSRLIWSENIYSYFSWIHLLYLQSYTIPLYLDILVCSEPDQFLIYVRCNACDVFLCKKRTHSSHVIFSSSHHCNIFCNATLRHRMLANTH